MKIFDIFRKKQPPAPVKNKTTFAAANASRHMTDPKAVAGMRTVDGNPITSGNTKLSGGKSRHGLSSYYKPLLLDHYALRLNNRYMLHDSKEARMVNRRFTDCVVGNGFRINPSPDADILGITPEQAESWAKDVKTRFDLWARSKDSDLTGTNTLYQNMRFCEWMYSRDGETYIRLNYSDNPKLLNPVQISFLDPNQIRGDEFTYSLGPYSQDTGIVTDENGAETGYKVWIDDPKKKNRYKLVQIPAVDKTSGRRLMLHGYNPEYAGQQRGYPEFSHGLEDFQDITSYSRSATKKMVNESTMGFTVENDMNDPGDMGLQDLDNTKAGPETISSVKTPSSTPRTLGVDAVSYRELNEATQTETGPLYLLGGAQGDKLVQIKSAGPGEKSGEFMDSQLKILAASRGIPVSVASMAFNKSHSALRGELGLFTDTKEIEKDDVVSDNWDLVYEAWMSEEIAAGRIRAPGWADPILKAAWLRASWSSTRVPDVDPEKTMRATILAIATGLTDLDTEAANYNNSDGQTNRAKLIRQLSELKWNPFDYKLPPIVEGIVNNPTPKPSTQDE
jgi:capsid protein